MQEIKDDIWNYHKKGFMIVIPTNGFVKNNDEAVMGRGLALQASTKFPELPKLLGQRIKEYGNVVFTFSGNNFTKEPNLRLITFPVKHKWWERANLQLIEKSTKELAEIFKHNLMNYLIPVYLPRVGCGNGKLNWIEVRPILERYLNPEKFVICSIS